jgi:hypothetical protein
MKEQMYWHLMLPSLIPLPPQVHPQSLWASGHCRPHGRSKHGELAALAIEPDQPPLTHPASRSLLRCLTRTQYELVRVGTHNLIGEVIRLEGDSATIQVRLCDRPRTDPENGGMGNPRSNEGSPTSACQSFSPHPCAPQVYEETAGLCVGDLVARTKKVSRGAACMHWRLAAWELGKGLPVLQMAASTASNPSDACSRFPSSWAPAF